MSEGMETQELTDREKAIAQGLNPDDVQETEQRVLASPGDDATEGASAQEAEEGTDAPSGDSAAQDEAATEEVAAEDIAVTETEAAEGETEAAAEDTAVEGTAAKETDWVTDRLLGKAASLGVSEQQLREFSGPAEFDRAVALWDGQDHTAVRETVTQQVTTEKVETEDQPADAKPPLDLQKYVDAGYDEDTLNLVRAQNTAAERAGKLSEQNVLLGAELVRIREDSDKREQAQYLNAFHDSVDEMEEGLFGRDRDSTGQLRELSREHDGNREKLFEMVRTISDGIVVRAERTGSAPVIPPLPVLLDRAQQVVFGEDLRRQEREKIHKEAAAQSKKRRPAVGRAKPSQAAPVKKEEPQSDADVALDIANHPDVVAAFEKANKS